MKPAIIQTRQVAPAVSTLHKSLLLCGAISSIWYIVVNIIVTPLYPGYIVASYTVSELSAIDAPTRSLWVLLLVPFSLFLIAFGWGIWLSADQCKKLRFVAIVIIFDAIFGSFWPPMHQREVTAAGGGTINDTLHLVWAYVHLIFMLLMMGFGAAALGKRFRIYSILTVVVFIVFGILTSMESPGIKAGTPTPYIGIWERINIGAYMLWVAVFAIHLLKRNTNMSSMSGPEKKEVQ